MSLLDKREFHELNEEEKRQVIEARALMFGSVTGGAECVCRFCGNVFPNKYGAARHSKTSKKCLELRNKE
jgi:hypothetical protein